MRLEFLIIDPQNDFSDAPEAALPVPGARADAERLADLLDRLGNRIAAIHVTLDTHQLVDISHPIFWRGANDQPPPPFTQITVADVERGVWRAFNPEHQTRALAYVRALRDNGRYTLTLWPPHCLVGTWGHGVMPVMAGALRRWEETRFDRVSYVTKGHNPWTEHYSAVRADVPDPDDPGTQLNTRLIQTLERADRVALSGQALSHCVANTVRDIADCLGPKGIRKLVLIEDTSSPVPGFEDLAARFLADLRQRGMQTVRAVEFQC
ncbi:MAG TPA: isochorismatase family protein [Candidatus Contendobacter sp.]|nr:isochorismatase family protein [Candidatus Contendobacter sp.]